ncbi:MAG: DNA mismatch repair protein MutS [Ktedonobacterales bacterium]
MSTPARRQYLDIKAQHQDALLAYQIGDFFEFFDQDAHTVAHELQIALTGRSYGPTEVAPLAGVPVHAFGNYVARLVARGYKVAVCEQTSPPGHGLVRREVTRVLTPGATVEPGMIPVTRDNYLAAIAFGRRDPATDMPRSVGLAYVDASTGAFACAQWSGAGLAHTVQAELQRITPAETLLADHLAHAPNSQSAAEVAWTEPFLVSYCPDDAFDPENARIHLCRHFGVPTLGSFGCDDLPLAVAAAGAILAYLERMNRPLTRLLTGLRTYDTTDYVEIDGRSWRALEVVEPAHVAPAPPRCTPNAQRTSASTRPVTLLGVLDATRTAMGARLLRRTLLHPLRDRLTLEERLDAVAELHERPAVRERLGAALDGLGDLERLTGRIVQGVAVPRELYALAAGLARVPTLTEALQSSTAGTLCRTQAALDPCMEARELILRAVAMPGSGDGRTLQPGYHAELDALVASVADARQWIAALEAVERERTGIRSLKVGFNKVFGYYIEVSKSNVARTPADYQRRQTLSTGERYVTADLKEREALVLSAEEQITALERTLYSQVLSELGAWQVRLRATVAALAQIDLWLALAEVAVARNYTRPELSDGTELEIIGGRHPIVEATLDGAEFVPNDTQLDTLETDAGARMLLLTGPNMAGKSTYLRQVALITLLAQIGSFTPAKRARIGLVDRIFTRVGAEDDLARGLSTFMLEMVETAYILRHATPRSLVVLDEVGRGTSAGDGIAIAQAVVEHLHAQVGARTLFATHYHELARLSATLTQLRVACMAVAERDGQAIFLHRVLPGVGDSSYGVQVARMAGLPTSVTARAAGLIMQQADVPAPLARIAETATAYAASTPVPENEAAPEPSALHATSNHQTEYQDEAVDDTQERPTRELALALASLNIAAMTPLDALNLLFSLQQRALSLLRLPPMQEIPAIAAPAATDAQQGK